MNDWKRRSGTTPGATTTVQRSTSTPGKRTRAPLQRRDRPPTRPGPAGGHDPHDIAARGTAGAGSALPHLDVIQRAFGPHDVSAIHAHVGGAAAEAARDLGAEAFATGNQVAFAEAPSLHLAAHEAAHVVQQRAGVFLKDGLGDTGDLYERNADEVADRVVAGQSAVDLLPSAGQARAAAAVQRSAEDDLDEIDRMRRAAPPDSGLHAALGDAHAASAHVAGFESVPAGGHAVRRFDAAGNEAGYDISYQGGADKEAWERIGNLVHELTHVAVNEAYRRDFVNYANPPRAVPPAATFTQTGRMTNEAARQTAQMNPLAGRKLSEDLMALRELVAESGLAPERVRLIRDKLLYGAANPSKEHDTVLNQVIVWCALWEASAATPFYLRLEALVLDAHARRTSGTAVDVTPAAPVAAPVDAPADQPAEDASRGVGCCYLTTACVTARGLADDCDELQTLRGFRDGYLRALPGGDALIEQYYRTAPAIVARIEASPDAPEILEHLYGTVIAPCVRWIKSGDNQRAFDAYVAMVEDLERRYLA